MTKLISLFIVVLALVAGSAMAAPNLLGTSGTIFTPDDTVLPAAGFSANYDGISLDDQTPNIYGASVGTTGELEIGLTHVDADLSSGGRSTLLNAKYLVLSETAVRPSLVVGAVDMTGDIDPDGDGGFYALIGKSLTSAATDVTGRPSAPLHGYIGYGGGIYDGIFAGLSLQVTPNLRVMGEFIDRLDISDIEAKDSMVNFGASFSFTDELAGNAYLLDGDDFAYGISYVKNL